MRGIIGHPKGAPDHLARPFARPDLAPKARGLGSTVQERRQLGALLGGELRRAARGRMRPQSFLNTLGPGARQPLAHRS